MNSTAIYSKSGKGVQEAAGKTSVLKRPDRAVLSAIDGRATLADVAQKVGKTFDKEFESLIAQLDKDGFIREVSAGAAAKPAAKPAAGKPAAPTAPMDAASDLDFSSFAPTPKPAAAPPPKPASAPPPRPAPPPKPAAQPAAPPPKATAPAKEQQSALNKAREEAEAKAAEEREKQKAEAEAKVRAEMEAKLRAEAEEQVKEQAKEAATNKIKAEAAAKAQAEADAKIKSAREAAVRAAAEAKAKADAEAKRAREEAENAKREADEMKKRLESERKAREEAERKAKEEAERARKQLEEERRQLEEERKRREEEERKKEEERAERRRREEEEEQARRRQREEEERKVEEEREARRREREEEDRKAEEEREARRKQREEEQRRADEEERRQEEERVARRKQEQEERRQREDAEAEAEANARAAQKKTKTEERVEDKPKPAAKAADSGASFSDTLLSDLDSFGKKDDEERKEKEEAERKAKEESKRRAREEAERKEREEDEQRQREAEERKRKRREEEEAREREEEEERERKKKEKEEARRREDEEAKREAEEKENKRKKARKGGGGDDDIPITDDDLDTDDVKRDQRDLARAEKASPRPKEAPRVKLPPPVSGPSMRRKPVKWGKPVAILMIALLVGGLGVAHLLPIETKPYADAASEALGQPVKIGSARLWLFGGSLQLKLQDVTVGDATVKSVNTFPSVGSLSDPKKLFGRIEIEGLTLPQPAAGEALFARAKSENFSVERLIVKQLQLSGPLVLPKSLDADIAFDASGAPSAVTLRGPDSLVIKLSPKGSSIDVDVTSGGFTLPIAPEVTLSSFAMKGSATRQGLQIEKWDGTLLNGNVTGTAAVRWGAIWSAEGVFTMRGINAAVFAPALLSEGRGEGTAKFQLSGADPAKLASSGRFEGTFTVNAGALGSFDLNSALQTGGKRASGRTPFTEMTGQVVYQAGSVELRNITLSAGSAGNMNAGASVDIAANGALSGRIVADVRTPNQTLRATLNLGGTVKEPQVRN